MCSEYGWTIEQWFSHTMREIAILLQRLVKRDQRLKEIERAFHASIHGVKLETPIADMDKANRVESNSEEDAKIEAHLKQRLKDIAEGKK